LIFWVPFVSRQKGTDQIKTIERPCTQQQLARDHSDKTIQISPIHQCQSEAPDHSQAALKYLHQYLSFFAIHFLKVFFVYLNMTKAQLKTEIQKALDSVPENVLQDVLDYLKALQHQPNDKVRLANNLRQILSEDKELLERLAK